jgi:hypothetical protein
LPRFSERGRPAAADARTWSGVDIGLPHKMRRSQSVGILRPRDLESSLTARPNQGFEESAALASEPTYNGSCGFPSLKPRRLRHPNNACIGVVTTRLRRGRRVTGDLSGLPILPPTDIACGVLLNEIGSWPLGTRYGHQDFQSGARRAMPKVGSRHRDTGPNIYFWHWNCYTAPEWTGFRPEERDPL